MYQLENCSLLMIEVLNLRLQFLVQRVSLLQVTQRIYVVVGNLSKNLGKKDPL